MIPKTHKPLHHHMHGDHSCSNCIIAHPLYGYVQPLGCRRPKSGMPSIQILGSTVARYRLGVLSRKEQATFTHHDGHQCANRIIIHPSMDLYSPRAPMISVSHRLCPLPLEPHSRLYSRCTIPKIYKILPQPTVIIHV